MLKTLLRTALCSALALTPVAPGFARAAPQAEPAAPAAVDADPALWVVRDDDTTIYLFGTVHVLKPGLSWFDEAVKAAFEESDKLTLEIDEPDPAALQPLMMRLGIDAGQEPLSKTLAEKGPAYLKAMAAIGVPQATADRFKPWLAATILSVGPLQKLGYSPENGPEHVLTAAANDAGKTLGALETAQQQFGYLSGLSQSAQREFLVSTLDDLPRIETMMGDMVADWSAGDPKALSKLLNDAVDDNPELAKTLLYDRNERWAKQIKAMLDAPGTVFIAVGAGHLAGPHNVRADLKALGVASTRIDYD